MYTRKQVGYTHRISWSEKHKDYGEVTKSFPTTKDAVDLHVKAVNSTGLCYNVKVETIKGTP